MKNRNIIYVLLCLVSMTSCSLQTISNEELFKCLKGIDYTIETGYAVIDGRENNIYDVELHGPRFIKQISKSYKSFYFGTLNYK